MNLKSIATSRSDVFRLPRSAFAIRAGFNPREDMGDIDGLAESIIEVGIKDALTGHKNAEDKIEVTQGHRRIAGFDRAIEILNERIEAAKGTPDAKKLRERKAFLLGNIPLQAEPVGYTDTERHFDTLILNDGKPLTILEEARQFKVLMVECQISEREILAKTGKSRTHFQNCMMLLNDGHDFVLRAISKGKISNSLAVEIVRKIKDKDVQMSLVKQAIETAAAQGKDAASAKHLTEAARSVVAPSKTLKKNGAAPQTPERGEENGGDDLGLGGTEDPKPGEPGSTTTAMGAMKLAGKSARTPAAPRETLKLTEPSGWAVPFDKKITPITAELLFDRVNGKEYVLGLQIQYPGMLGPKGYAPEATQVPEMLFATIEEARAEALATLKDHLHAFERTASEKERKTCKILAAANSIPGILEALRKEEAERLSKLEGAPLPPDASEGESLVPGATQTPTEHIIALRDALAKDKRMAKKKEHPAYIALNFIADYLEGGKYEPEQFEAFFSQFVIAGKQ